MERLIPIVFDDEQLNRQLREIIDNMNLMVDEITELRNKVEMLEND